MNPNLSEAPLRRRWLRFSLRTMLVVLTAVCVWLAYSLDWIRQRHEALTSDGVKPFGGPFPDPNPPVGLWLLGESGVNTIVMHQRSSLSFDEVQRLFPEAMILPHVNLSNCHSPAPQD